ncbi:MAG: replicative DNA helicase [Anaerolineae bacterium]
MTGSSRAERLWIHEKTTTSRIKVAGQPYQIKVDHPFPKSEVSERAVIGGILFAGQAGQGREAFLTAFRLIRPDDFYYLRYANIYIAMTKLAERKAAIDINTVAEELDRGQKLLMVGGQEHLFELANSVTPNALETHAMTVADCAMRRALMVSGGAQMALAANTILDLDTLLTRSQRVVLDVITRISSLHEVDTFDAVSELRTYVDDIVSEAQNPDQPTVGLDTGLYHLNNKILGWVRQRLYVIGGSSGMGKSALMLTSTVHSAFRDKQRVLFISLELTFGEIKDRILANLAEVDSKKIMQRKLNLPEVKALRAAQEMLAAGFADNQVTAMVLSAPTIETLEARIDDMMMRHDYDIIFIDYIGWDRLTKSDPRMSNTIHVGDAYAMLERKKKDLNIPIIVGSQISRDHMKRKDKRPLLTDLADASVIEKGADAVMFIYRPSVAEKMPKFGGKRAEIVLRKVRYMPNPNDEAIVYVTEELHYGRFSTWKLPDQNMRDDDDE